MATKNGNADRQSQQAGRDIRTEYRKERKQWLELMILVVILGLTLTGMAFICGVMVLGLIVLAGGL